MGSPRWIEVGGVRWWLAAPESGVTAAPLLAAALCALAEGRTTELKRRPRKRLHALRLGAGPEPDHLLKVTRYATASGLREALFGSRVRRELELAVAAARRGIDTPRPIAAGERRRGARIEAGYLLVERRTRAVDLRRLWLGAERSDLAPAEARALACGFGAFARRVHDAGLFQDDFAPNNFLVERGAELRFLMIDFERVRLRARIGARRRRWMLAKLERELAQSSRSDRMRFLLAYARGSAAEARRWWRRVEAYAPRLAARDARRLARSERPGHSGVHRVQLAGGWSGVATAGVETPLLEAALASRAECDAWRIEYPELSALAARRLWTHAHLLARHRALAPAPLALLRRGGSAVLLLRRSPADRRLSELRVVPAAALRVLLGRLLGLGRLLAPPSLEALAAVPIPGSGMRVVLLDPALLRPGGAGPRGCAAARGLAEALLARRPAAVAADTGGEPSRR